MSPSPPLADIRAPNAPAVVILGNDAQLAARPATPVQLAHACLAAGFRAAVPASWGDELVAGATLTALATRTERPAIQCSCPHVARRLLAVGPELAAHMVSLVAPPVAAARYLRLHAAGELRVTYVGRCPAAADDSIDARLTPEELLAQFADRGIDLSAQPEVFESVIPPDRRRHLSVPGGLPSADVLWERAHCAVATMAGDTLAEELAELVLSGSDTLIDPALAVGCACSGVTRGVEAADARMVVVALEPPRAAYPVVDEDRVLALDLSLPIVARAATDFVGESGAPPARDEQRVLAGPADALGVAPPSPPVAPHRRPRLTPPGMAVIAPPPVQSGGGGVPRRRSPTGTPRVGPGPVPVSSDSEGRVLPRAYVARRRSPRTGVPAITDAELSPARAAPLIVAPAQQSPERDAGATAARADSERPMVRSIEPTAARPVTSENAADSQLPDVRQPPSAPSAAAERAPAQPPVAVPALLPAPQAATQFTTPIAPPIARVARGAALLRQHSWMAVGILAGAGLLLGVAIGYSAGRRGGGAAQASNGAVDRVDDAQNGHRSDTPSVRESVSSGGIAPAPAAGRRPAVRPGTRTAPMTPNPASRRAVRTTTVRPDVAAPAGQAPPAPAPVTAPPVAAVADTAAARARRDSVSRAEALAAERMDIQREIDVRRARLDSIQRARTSLDSLQRGNSAAPPGP